MSHMSEGTFIIDVLQSNRSSCYFARIILKTAEDDQRSDPETTRARGVIAAVGIDNHFGWGGTPGKRGSVSVIAMKSVNPDAPIK